MSEYIFPVDHAQTPGDYDGTFDGHLDRKSVNPGVDFPVGIGSKVYATRAGRVRVVSNGIGGSGGRYVELVLDNGVVTQDLHLSRILVNVGDEVAQGDVIALSGASANGSERGVGPHVHHSHIENGVRLDFLLVMAGQSPVLSSPGGHDVATIQTLLGQRGFATAIDGQFGPDTAAKVRAFQAAAGITVDGIVGPVTWGKLNEAAGPPQIAVDGQFGPATVTALQRLLGVAADGQFGPQTVAQLQRVIGAAADGQFGPQTIGILQRVLGVTDDGQFGSQTVAALQSRINSGQL